MKIRLADLKAMEKSFEKLLNKELNVKIAYRLGKLVKNINDEFKDLEESRIRLVKKYGTRDEKTDQIEVDKDKIDLFIAEYNEFLGEEIEIDFQPIPLSELGDIQLTPIEMSFLDDIIIE